MQFKETDYYVKQDFDETSLDYSKADKYISGIDVFSRNTDSCFFIFDYFKHKYLFLKSYNEYFTEHLNIIDNPYLFFNNKLHPEDVVFVYKLQHKVFSFVKEFPIENRQNFRLKYKVRMINKSGDFQMTDVELILLETDKNGNIWLVLFVLKKSSTENFMIPELRTADNTSIPFVLNLKLLNSFSQPEQDIIFELFSDKSNEEIALKLSRSVNTVKYHKKSIYDQMGVVSKFELQKRVLLDY